jgi:hypothetical protein
VTDKRMKVPFDLLPEATGIDAFNAKFCANQKITGSGIGNVMVHMPCPFCAEPDFVVYEVLTVQTAMGEGAVCKSCQRGAKAVFTRHASGISFEIVQTVGPDAPSFLPPIRRATS